MWKHLLWVAIFGWLLLGAFGPIAAAQSPPTLRSATFYGGSGDQRGSGAAIQGSNIYISGFQQVGGLHGLLIKETAPPSGPVWTTVLPDTNFNGLAATASTLYPVGQAEAAHFGGKPGTCGASDFAGDHERKSMFARFNAAGTFLGCGSFNYFPYRGHELYNTALAVDESGSMFIYAAGRAEQTGFAFSLPFVMTKYTDLGAVVGSVTEPGITLGSFGCCPGESDVVGLAKHNGHLYLAGQSRLPGFGEDNVIRPVLMKYSGLIRIWKARATDLAGVYRSVVGLGGNLYVAGNAVVGGQSDYLVAKYGELGTRIWSVTSGGAGEDVLTGVVGIGSRLFAVGYTRSSGAGGADAVILEIDPATGATLSTTLFGGTQDDFANGAATDGTDLYVVGESRSFASPAGNTVGQNDLMLLRYSFNHPPVANAGPDQTVECTGPSGTPVTLNGSASNDPDGDALSFQWTDDQGNIVGTTAVVRLTLPLGIHTFTLTVNDGKGGIATDSVAITIRDTTPPLLNVSLSPNVLWPPDHRLVPITANIRVSDTCDPNPSIVLVSITSNEPDNGLGDGDMPNDIQGASFGTDSRSFFLRAERSGTGTGRLYTVTYRATDHSGNTTLGSAQVRVPHDQGNP